MQNKINTLNTQYNINNLFNFIDSVESSIENNITYELDNSKWQSNAKNKFSTYLEHVTMQMEELKKSLKKIEELIPSFEKINDLNYQVEMLEKENINLEMSLTPENSIKLQENKAKIEALKNNIEKLKQNIKMGWI